MADTAAKMGLQRQWRRSTMITVPAAVVDRELPEIGFYALGVYLAACRLADGGRAVTAEALCARTGAYFARSEGDVDAALTLLVARDLLVAQHAGTYLVQEPRR